MTKRTICVFAVLLMLLSPAGLAFQKGDTGEEVARLQAMLIDAGYLYGSPDGVYGGYTQKAAKAYMRAWEIDEDMLSEHLAALTGEGAYAAYRLTLSAKEDTALLQKKLCAAGYLETCSGEYDEDTRLAEKTWRIANAVSEEEPTLSALSDVFEPMRKGDRGAEVALLQSLLIDGGYRWGVADGVFGERTRKAVVKAQKAYSMEANGIADEKLMKRLLQD